MLALTRAAVQSCLASNWPERFTPLDIAGTLSYRAPEILLGRKASLKSDIDTFGILLWELISIERAFKKLSGCLMQQLKEYVLVN